MELDEMLDKLREKAQKKIRERQNRTPQAKSMFVRDDVRSYIPIRDIREGYIETATDMVKILEISPMNFETKTDLEQNIVIDRLARMLKVAPYHLQFGSLTNPADITELVDRLQTRIESEPGNPWNRLARSDIRLMQDISNREAFSRIFYVVISYPYRDTPDSRNHAVSELKKSEMTLRNGFASCGNFIVEHANEQEWTLSLLYRILQRRKSISLPFRLYKQEIDRKVAQMGIPEAEISPLSYVLPHKISFTRPKCWCVDGVYYATVYVSSNGFLHSYYAGWVSQLCHLGEYIDVNMFVRRADDAQFLSSALRLNIQHSRSVIETTRATSSKHDHAKARLNASVEIFNGLQGGQELYYFGVYITVLAASEHDLLNRVAQVRQYLTQNGMDSHTSALYSEEAFAMTLPLDSAKNPLWTNGKRNILTEGLAATYMFNSFALYDTGGIFLGKHCYNRNICAVNFFDTSKYQDANVFVIAATGSGKTFMLQTLATRFRYDSKQVFIIAPKKGEEYERCCTAVGGTFLKISPDSSVRLNIMDIYDFDTAHERELRGDAVFDNTSKLAAKIQNLISSLSLLIPDLSLVEEEYLNEALYEAYEAHGITKDNRSLYDEHGQRKTMPLISEVIPYYRAIAPEGSHEQQRVSAILRTFTRGDLTIFNEQTNVKLDNPYIVFDISANRERYIPFAAGISLDFMMQKSRSDRTAEKVAFIDEDWSVCGPQASKQSSDLVLELCKTGRAWGLSSWFITQDLKDNGEYAERLINNCQFKLIGATRNRTSLDAIQHTLELTDKEVALIASLNRGQFLLSTKSTRIPVDVVASDALAKLITTDHNELKKQISSAQTGGN